MTISSQLSLFNSLISLGVLLVLAYSIVLSCVPKLGTQIPKLFRNSLLVTIATASILGPILYQYYFGFPACTMCWYQRIFMWPISFMIIGTALWSDSIGRKYVLSAIKWLAPIGFIFSVWHYISQWGLTSTASACGAVGQSVSCDGIDVLVWGFMTIPLMAGLGFISLFLLLRTYNKS